MGEEYGNYEVDHVTCDNIHIGQIAFDYLREKECAEIALLSLYPTWFFMRLRTQSFLNAAYNSHQPATAYIVSEDPMVIDSYGKRVVAAKTAEELVAKIAAATKQTDWLIHVERSNHGNADARFQSQRSASRARYQNHFVRQRGIEAGRFLHPRPATIDIHPDEVGRLAVERLIYRMRNPAETPLIIRVTARLVISNGKPIII